MKQGIGRIHREWGGKSDLRKQHTFGEVVTAVEKVKGEGWAAFAGRHEDWGRDVVLAAARRCTEVTVKAIGQAADGMDYAVVSVAVQRLGIRRQRERAIQTAFNRAAQLLNVKA